MPCGKEKGNHAAVFPNAVHVPALLSEVKQLKVQHSDLLVQGLPSCASRSARIPRRTLSADAFPSDEF
jgi:hypothetical protein